MGNIFIISGDLQQRKIIKGILAAAGHRVLGESGDAMASLRVLRNLALDLILLDSDMKGGGSMEIAQIIAEDRIAPILYISSTWSGDLVKMARSTWVFAFALKPLNEVNLLPAVESAVTSYKHLSRAEKKVDELEKALASRKVIEEAKGLMMEHLKISEREAYARIRRQSMNKGVPLLEIARAVILLYRN